MEETTGLTPEDAQTLRDISFRVRTLLGYRTVLPAGLVVMLREYLPELSDMTGGRWDGIGDPCQYAHLAGHIAQDITDGKWADGDRVYPGKDGNPAWYFSAERREVIRRALQLLAARGEITVRQDGYYVRSHDDNP